MHSFFYIFRYESKGKQFQKNKPTHPVGMSEEYVAARKAARNEFIATKTNPIPGLIIDVTETKKKKKKSKSKEVASITEGIAKTMISTESSNNKSKTKPALSAKQVSTTDPLKRLKNLRKKIREIESLDKKIKSGEIKQPDKEMLEKVSKKAEIEQEIKVLESNQ